MDMTYKELKYILKNNKNIKTVSDLDRFLKARK